MVIAQGNKGQISTHKLFLVSHNDFMENVYILCLCTHFKINSLWCFVEKSPGPVTLQWEQREGSDAHNPGEGCKILGF